MAVEFVDGLETNIKEANAGMRKIKQRIEFCREIKQDFEKEENAIRQEQEKNATLDNNKKRKRDRS